MQYVWEQNVDMDSFSSCGFFLLRCSCSHSRHYIVSNGGTCVYSMREDYELSCLALFKNKVHY